MSFISPFFPRAFRLVLAGAAAWCAAGLCPGLLGQVTPTGLDGFIPNVGGVVNVVALDPDNKTPGQTDILVGGNFSSLQPKGTVTGLTCWSLVRLEPDGTPDATFLPDFENGPSPTVPNQLVIGQIFAAVVQPNGSIIVGGTFQTVNGVTRHNLARLNSDGSVDTTFQFDTAGNFSAEVQSLALDANGNLLVGGAFNSIGGVPCNRLARLKLTSGAFAVDTNFNPNPSAAVIAIALQPDGNLVVGGAFNNFQPNGTGPQIVRHHIARILLGSNNAVTVDPIFDPSTDLSVSAILVQPDGKVLVGGAFNSLQPDGASTPVICPNFARLNGDGSLDSTFQTVDPSGAVNAIALQPDGRILIGGNFIQIFPVSTGVGQAAQFLTRLNPDGTPDNDFDSNVGINGEVNSVVLQPDGGVVVGGNFNVISGAGAPVPCDNIARFDSNGLPDITFDPSKNGFVFAVGNQPSSGDLIIGGSFTSIGGVASRFLARISPSGVLDSSFNPNVNGSITLIVVEPNNSILIAGNFASVQGVARNGVARLNSDGTLDTQFDPDPGAVGSVSAIAVQSDGKILLGGTFTSLKPDHATASVPRQFIARVNADGTLDTAFDPEGNAAVNSIALQSNGQILVGGAFTSFKPGGATNTNATLITIVTAARLNSDGSVDQNFNPGPGGVVNAIAVQADGNILIGGDFLELAPAGNSGTPTAENYLARVTPAHGDIDPTFLTPNLNGEVNQITPLPNGQSYISGFFSASAGVSSQYGAFAGNYFVRLNKDGSTDGNFVPSIDAPIQGYSLQPDGTLYLGGDFTIVDGSLASQIVHVSATGSLDSSFALSSAGASGSTVKTLALGLNGALIAGGDFSSGIGGGVSSNIVRISLGGAPDSAFAPNANGPVNAVVTLNSGAPITTQLAGLVWLNSDGTQRHINIPAGFQITGTVETVAVDPGKYIYVGGAFTNNAAAPVGGDLIRFNYSDGSLDTTFVPNPQGPVQVVTVQPDEKILIGGAFSTIQPIGAASPFATPFLARLNVDGSVDTSFVPNPNSSVDAITLQPNGQILVGGGFTTLQPNGAATGTTEISLARLNADGTLDKTFNPDPSAQVTTIVLQPDGKILIGGDFTNIQPLGTSTAVVRNNIARLNSDGSIDLAFDPEANGGINAILVQPDGEILIGGAFTTLSPGAATETPTALVSTFEQNFIARLFSNGTVDTSFNPNPNGSVNAIAYAPDGNSIYIAGFFNFLQSNTALSPTPRNFLAQLLLDGTVVGGFDPQLNNGLVNLLVQPDGSLILGGSFTTIDPQGILLVGGQFNTSISSPSLGGVALNYLGLLRDDGTAVETFNPNPNGAVDALAIQANGQILAGGAFTTLQPNGATAATAASHIARINGDGSQDAAFNGNAGANGEVDAIAVQTNGQLVIAGQFTQVDGQAANGLARLNSDGTIDSSFVASVNGPIDALALQADGKILIGGSFTSVGGFGQSYLARLGPNGAPDTGFAPVVTGSGAGVGVSSILVEANGGTTGSLIPTFQLSQNTVAVTPGTPQTLRILIGGTFSQVGGIARSNLAQIQGDGSLDPNFNPGADNTVNTLLLQTDGRLFAAGAFSMLGGQSRFRLGRVSSFSPAPADLTAPNEDVLPITQALGVSTDLSAIVFTRNGGPELSEVDFQVSTDDATWTDLGFAGRLGSSSDWIRTGLSLPANTLFYVRAFGVAPTSQNSSSGLTLFTASFAAISPIATAPVFGSATAINVVVGQPFYYAAAATSSPTGFSVTGTLPPGLSLNTTTGVISGTPTQTGPFAVTLEVSNAAGNTSVPLVFTVGMASTAAPLSTSRLVSVAALGDITSSDALISGLAIGGSAPKTVLLRAVGPSLTAYGVSRPLSNPVLYLYNSAGQQILTSGPWNNNSELAQIFEDLGAFPFANSADVAVVTTLAPGDYSLQVVDGAGTGGTALAEVYDADDDRLSLPQRILSLSARGGVGPSPTLSGVNDILIGGFYIDGPSPKKVLVRGTGPTLSNYGVTTPLPTPYLQVFAVGQVPPIAANQGYSTPLTVDPSYPAASGTDISTAAASVGAFPFLNPGDTAVILTLPPGGYSAQISSADGQRGTALFEVYELP